MKKYITSGLVMENSIIEKIDKQVLNDDMYSEDITDIARICRLNITNQDQEKEYGCRNGRYITIYTSPLWKLGGHEAAMLSDIIAQELRSLIKNSGIGEVTEHLSVLAVGIGNRQITPDAIGPATVDKLTVTRHIKNIAPVVYRDLGMCSVAAINCGVMGDTGMQTSEIIKGIVSHTNPDIIVAIDALAAKEYDRLASTIQISDNGIVPGSGIGNRSEAIDRVNLGIPVIAIGVPTVVSAATLIGDSLRRSGKTKVNEKLERILDGSKDFFVAPKECDIITVRVSDILSRAVDKALSVITDK